MKNVRLNDYKTLMIFPVAHLGWECDSKGYVVKDAKGEVYLILTSHGGFYLADKEELIEKLSEYQEWIDKTKAALNLLP